MIRLVPHVLVFGLLASAMAWLDLSSRRVDVQADQGPKVLVAEHTVPTLDRPEVTESGRKVVAKLAPRAVKTFSLVGVTWKSGVPADAEVDIKWRRASGAWTDWTDVHQELVPAEGGRPGTEPQYVGESANAIAVRISTNTPSKPVDLRVATLTPRAGSTVTPMAVSQPGIILRAQWGAVPQTQCTTPIYGSTTMGAVIHHTVGSNSYTAAQSAGIVLAIQKYHMQQRGWCDIGYNFLVDRYGQIFEGRAGGIDKPVRAAHAGVAAFNELTMGVSLMGTFTTAAPTEEMKTAVVNLVSWRFSQYGIPATGPVTIGGKTVDRIAAHGDVVSTECPGAQVRAWMTAPGGLRERVAAVVGAAAAFIPSGLYTVKAGRKKLVLAWAPIAGVRAYRVRLSRTPDFTRSKVALVKKTKSRFTDLHAGATFYVQVRAVKRNGKPLGEWSAPLTTATPL